MNEHRLGRTISQACGAASLILLLAFVGGSAQESTMTNKAELSFVLASGNASATTLGVRNTTEFEWESASLQLAVGGIRTRSEKTTRTATGTVDDFDIVETRVTDTTAESYFARGRYDHTFASNTYAFGSAGWQRNTFSGFDARTSLGTGVGRNWTPGENQRLKTDVGVTYTVQDDVVRNPAVDRSFAGFRASVDFLRPVTETTSIASAMVLDENLSETSDLRIDWTNSVSVSISSGLALKTTVQVLFDNDPALVSVPLGTERVLTPLDEIDSVFTVSVVVDF